MKNTLSLLVVGLSFLGSLSARADGCPEPAPNASTAFHLVEDPKLGQLSTFLQAHLVSKTALNEKCETLYQVAIRSKNETARIFLDSIGYGPKNTIEINQRHPYKIKNRNYWVRNLYEYALMFGNYSLITNIKNRGGTLGDDYKKQNVTPLMLAASENNSLEVVNALIASGENVNARTNDSVAAGSGFGRSALMLAAGFSSLEVMRALLAAGAEADPVERPDGMSPLIYAASSSSDSQIVLNKLKLLIEAKANVNRVAVLDYPYLKQPRKIKRTALSAAVDNHPSTELVEFLLAAGAKVNEEGTGILISASRGDNVAVLQLLMKAGANLVIKDWLGQTALIAATKLGTISMMRTLLRAGIDENEVDFSGRTALMYAVDHYRISPVAKLEVLIRGGSDINAQDYSGNSALMIAAEICEEKAVETLVLAGADKTLVNKLGKSAAQIAVGKKCDEKVKSWLTD